MPKYEIFYHPRSIKFLKKLSSKERDKILTKIETPNLDIKKLINTTSSYRMRHGNIRIIFEIDNKKRKIYINEIDFRGNVY